MPMRMQTVDGKIKCQLYRCTILSENFMDWMSRFNSSTRFFPGFSALRLLETIQKDLEGKRIKPDEFSDRIIFMSMFNDIDMDKKRERRLCVLTSRTKKFKNGPSAFLGVGGDNKWNHDYESNYEGEWDLRASKVVDDFERSGHPAFKGICPLGREILKKKKGKDTIHFNGEQSNIDLLFRTVHSANQFCIHGAVTQSCGTQSGTESGKRGNPGYESARRTPRENEMKREELTQVFGGYSQLPLALGNRMLQNLESFESMPRRSQIEFLQTTAGFYHPVKVGRKNTLILHKEDGWGKCTSLCKEYTKPRNDKGFETVCFD